MLIISTLHFYEWGKNCPKKSVIYNTTLLLR